MVEVFETHPLDPFFKASPASVGEGVSVAVIVPGSMVQVFAAKGKVADIEEALAVKSAAGQASVSGGFTALPLSPGQWLVVTEKADAIEEIASKINGKGYVSEQSDSRIVFRLSGPRVRELMQKGCRLDLHADKTGKGWCAQTQMAQVSVLLHQIADAPVYDLYVASGFAQHFAEWLEHTGAQLGIGFSR